MGKKRTIGVKDLLKKKFVEIDMSEDWKRHLGRGVTKKFHISVTGDSSNGKTTYVLQLVKELSRFGRVYYNSVEQGFNKTLQTNVQLVDMPTSGKIMFGENLSFDDLMKKFSNKHFRCNYLVIDSRDFMDLSVDQYKQLKEVKRGNVGIITVHHSNGSAIPESAAGKMMRRDADVKVHVAHFAARCIGRFGETKPYIIWKDGHEEAMREIGKPPINNAVKVEQTLFN